MALRALMEALRCHFANACLGSQQHRGAPPADRLYRFSERQRQRLVDHIAAAMHAQIGAA